MDWFEKLMGFDERSPQQVKGNILVSENKLISKINQKSYQFGSLETPSLKELKRQAGPLHKHSGPLKLSEIIGDVQKLHCDQENEDALFQAASQFNLLEMVGPNVRPEQGIGRYENDRTQGPACAIACGAGTIYRNYLVDLNGKKGQSVNNQIDCLEEMGHALNNKELKLWDMQNGYALASITGLQSINPIIHKMDELERQKLKDKLKIGIQWNTEVTLGAAQHYVSQAYCSALPVAYSRHNYLYWESFARLILEASYEATLYAAVVNLNNYHSNKVYLTLLGGGAFGNQAKWISDAMLSALAKFKDVALDVKIVNYGSSHMVKDIIQKVQN